MPLRLIRLDRYSLREAQVQLVQGLLSGLGLCLLCYTLAQWVSVRESSFLLYALSVAASTLFSFSYFGLARQHLWPNQPWLVENATVLTMLLLATFGPLFLERSLKMIDSRPRLGRAMRGTATTAGLFALAFVAGLVEYRLAHIASNALGLLGVVIALPVAVALARDGDRAARCIVVGWIGLAVGIAASVGLWMGWLGNSVVTQHALQVAGVFEMLMWQLALGDRIASLRRAAVRW